MLEDLGLIPTLRSYVKTFAEQTGVRVCFSACVGVEKLDGERKIVLYRIAQESLIHVARHAQATEVEINIRNLKQGIRMEMRDNGKTLWTNPASTNGERKTLSLLGVQERVRLVNGDFKVESDPGKGTLLRVLVPLKAG